MEIETLEIGPCPTEEDCAQVGITDDYHVYNRLECRAYIAALRKVYGEPPVGTELRIKSSAHDFGTYREVVYKWSSIDPDGRVYANKVERGLAKWRDAGFWKPVIYERSQAVHAIHDTALLDMVTNPGAQPTRESRDADVAERAAREGVTPA